MAKFVPLPVILSNGSQFTMWFNPELVAYFFDTYYSVPERKGSCTTLCVSDADESNTYPINLSVHEVVAALSRP